jgi:hypothetical protein
MAASAPAIDLRAKTKNSFLSLLCLNGSDYGCEVCGTKDISILTRHHKLPQSLFKDNSLPNLKCLCREDHDLVERFYEWVIAFNVPYSLYKKRREIESKIGRIASIRSVLRDPKMPPPTRSAYGDLNLSVNYYNDNNAGKLRRLEILKIEYLNRRNSIHWQINEIILKTVNWDDLYIYAVQYAKSKRDK